MSSSAAALHARAHTHQQGAAYHRSIGPGLSPVALRSEAGLTTRHRVLNIIAYSLSTLVVRTHTHTRGFRFCSTATAVSCQAYCMLWSLIFELHVRATAVASTCTVLTGASCTTMLISGFCRIAITTTTTATTVYRLAKLLARSPLTQTSLRWSRHSK
jgi:hypothetical protein